MSIEVDTLSLKFVSEGSDVSSNLSSLAASLENLSRKQKSLSNLRGTIANLGKALNNIKTGNLARLSLLLDSLREAKDIKLPNISGFAKGLDALKKSDASGFAARMKEIKETLKDFDSSGLSTLVSDLAVLTRNAGRAATALKKVKEVTEASQQKPAAEPSGDIPSRTQAEAAASAEEIDRTAQSVFRLSKAADRLAGNAATKTLKDLSKAAQAALHPIRSLKSVLTKLPIVNKALSGLTSFFKLMKFRLFRMALTSIFNGVIQSFKYLYQYGGQFAATMDSISTSTKYLSNSIVAALAPAINALAPIIEIVVDKFVSLLNIVNQTIATLTGASTWTKAVRYAVAYDDSLSSAANSANALKRTLMGFDEINALNDTSSSSSSSSVDASKMFETLENTQTLTSLKEKFEDFFGVDVDPLLTSIGDLKTAFLDLFNKVKEKFEPFRQNVLIPFKNWIVEDVLPALLDAVTAMVTLVTNYMDFYPAHKERTESIENANGMQIPTSFLNDIADLLRSTTIADLEEILREALNNFFSWLELKLSGTWFGKLFGITATETETTKATVDVTAKVELNKTGAETANVFKRGWNATNLTVTANNTLKNSASLLVGELVHDWDNAYPVVDIINRLSNSASTLLNHFYLGWESSNPSVVINNRLNYSGSELWTKLNKEWGERKVSIMPTATKKLTIKDFLSTSKTILNWTPSATLNGYAAATGIGTFSFAARGGIVDGATLFGNTVVGEAGREAIIPLENHTEWMDGVADRLASKLQGGSGSPIVVQVTLDGRVVGQSTVNYIRSEARAGRDPLAGAV